MVDLHTHSTASDGIRSPKELVMHAKEHGISVLALTDHDTIDGLEEAGLAAQECGITFVPGVELNINWPTGEFHLLGLGLKSPSQDFLDILQGLKVDRKRRNLAMIQKMKDAGFDADLNELESMFSTNCLGRPHFAAYMVEKKVVKTRQQAFDKYLGKNCLWYVERTGADLDKAIAAIKNSGGIPVMAHPLSIYVSWGKIRGVLEELKARGIEGLEGWHPGARVGECKRLDELGRELGFFITAGSDYHGESVRADRKIGRTCGQIKIEDKFYYEELLPRLK
ncbi:MAG: PHP domain-containing protein [Treponema sp.]|nr:PHP domain-containing protein [Treponema sp.]